MSPSRDDRDLAEFLLRICHEMRSHARTVRTQAELLQRKSDDTESESLGFIVDGASRLHKVLDGLSEYSMALQIDRSSFQRVPMGAALRAAMSKLRALPAAADLQLTSSDLPTVQGDPDRLADAFRILLSNAVAHSGGQPPAIEVSAEAQPEAWLFTVRDHGPGVEPPYLETVFRPFERLKGKDTAGLGLTILRIIIERHGGKVWAEPAPGNGLSVRFTLPA
jgi:signal transduction histidine kinase